MPPWLLQSFADCPTLARGRAPAGLLSEREAGDLARLSNPKRRREWLLGRWCAKHLLQRVIKEQTGLRPSLDALEIVADARGAPQLRLGEALPRLDSLAPALSISHSGDYALCALALETGTRVGVDIEGVEERPRHFAQHVFTVLEQQQLQRAPAEVRALLLTIMWGAKEATLKARGEGLWLDAARRLSCIVSWPPQSSEERWYTLTVQEDDRLLPIRGGWRLHDEHVLTVVLLHS